MKLFSKIAALSVGLAMAVGVGVAVGSVKAEKVKAAETTDTITSANLAATNTTYTNFSSVSISSGAVYAGNSAKSSSGGIQMRSKNSNSGIVSTTSGGTVVSVTITVESGSNTVDVYGSNTAYSAASDLYGNSKGTKVGSRSTSGTISFTDSYSYVGIRSNNGAIYLTSISIVWDDGQGGDTYKVTYNANDTSERPSGEMPSSVTGLEDGATQTLSTAQPTRWGYTFAGWGLTATATSYVTSVTINGADVTVYAIWSEDHTISGAWSDSPYTVDEAKAAIDGKANVTGVYVGGIISQIDSFDSGHSSITYWISSDGTTSNQFECYSGKGLNGADFSAVTDIVTGAEVVVCGDIKLYNSTYEFNYNNYQVAYKEPTSSPLSSITLSGTYETSFDVGDTFSYDGLIVTAHYEDSSSKVVTPTSVSAPDMTSAGQKTVTVSYTEKEVTKTANYTITVNTVTYYTITFLPGDGSGSQDAVQAKEGSDYTLPSTTTFVAPEGKVFDYWDVYGEAKTVIENVDDDYEVTAMWKDKPSEVTDTLNNGNTINKVQTTYESWTTEAMSSGAVYAGQSAGDKTSIQLRSNNSNSGVVSTTSGGDLVSVTINFNTETSAGRTVSVYGKTTSYSNPTELYNSTTQGTLLGEVNINDGASQTIEVEGSYQYVGIRSKSGAMYIESIAIVWNGSVTPPEPKTVESISVSGAKTDFTVGDDFETTGLVVTAHYDDSSSSVVTSGYVVNSSAVDKTTAGVYTVTVTYEECSDSYDVTYTAPEPVVNKTYKKVKTNLANFSGDYLIVNEEASLVFNGSLETLDAENNVVSVTISDEKITAAESNEFTIAKTESAYSVKSHSGYYIGQTSDANGLKSSTSDPYDNAISYVNSEAVDMDIVSGGAHLRYNSASNQNRFRYYKSSSYTAQKAISLYMQVDDAEAVALEILNQTYADCQAFVDGESDYNTYKTKMAGIWTSIGTLFNAIEDSELKAKLVDGNADEDGTMLEQALARYDYLTAKYALDEVITGRDVPSLRYVPAYNTAIESDSAMIVVVIAAVVSLTSIAVLLVIKRRKTLVK